MSTLAEITSLFAKLASNLQELDPTAGNEDQELNLSISNVNRSLNFPESPRVTVLDTALSLMCFTSPQVYDKVIEYTVETIVSVLSSSIECKASMIGKDEVLRAGGSISPRDCVGLVGECGDVFDKLRARGDLCSPLLRALLRAAVLASKYRYTLDSSPVCDASLSAGSSTCSKLLYHLLKESDVDSGEPPLRGVASVLKLQTALVSLVLDISSRPMHWGFSLEIGSKLPFSHAYFPHNHQFLKILAGPLSCESLQHLVQKVRKSVSRAGKYMNKASQQATLNNAMVDHTSMWALAMNFPDWFQFASILVLCGKMLASSFHSSHSECALMSAEIIEPRHTRMNCLSAAASFIAWVLEPTREVHQDLLVSYLAKVSESWTLKCKSNEETSQNRTNANLDVENKTLQRCDLQKLYLWLQEFLDICNVYHRYVCNSTNGAEAPQGIGNQQSMLLRRIPLGIVIGCSSYIDEEGCELLLHFAASGTIFPLTETQQGRLKHRKLNRKFLHASIGWTEQYTRREAVAGACVVFDLTDVTESISASLFESEEIGSNLLCQVKLKSGKYLLKCIKVLLQLKTDEEVEVPMLKDLCKRMVRWRHQGKDVFQGYEDLENVIDALSHQPITL